MKSPVIRMLSAFLLLGSGAVLAGDGQFAFDVFLDARMVGTHEFRIQAGTDGAQQVTSVASFNVKILGITAYRYRHRAAERWQGGCLQQLGSSTDDNGRRTSVSRALREGCVSSYAYWNPELLLQQKQLLNPQTGEMDAVRIEARGEEAIDIHGKPVRADRYRLTSAKFVIDLWYSKQREWLQLESTTDTQRKLRYRRAALR